MSLWLYLTQTFHPQLLLTIFLIGIGCVFLQTTSKRKMDNILTKSSIFKTNEKKFSTTFRELTGIVYQLTISELFFG